MSLRFNNSEYSWYLPFLIIIVLIGSTLASIFIYRTIDTLERNSLLHRAETIAVALNPNEVTALVGDESDLTKPDYLDLKSKLAQIRESNPDSRFVYITGKRNNEIFFYADSEDSGSSDYSAPGDIYTDYSPAISGALDGISGTEGPLKDVYGNWVTGVAPLRDSLGNVVGAVGIDVDAELFQRNVYTYASIPLLSGLSVIIFIYAVYRVRRAQLESISLKAKFVTIASHELRTPLTGLVWASTSLANDTSVSLTHQGTIKEMSRVTKSLLESVNTILDTVLFDSKAKIIFYPVNLDEVIKDALKDLDLAAKDKGISINVVSPDGLVAIKGNKSKLIRAVANIVSNAIKYSPEKGTVEISLKASDKEAAITVTDHGIGIPKAEQGRILKGFYRATNAAESDIPGSGLGMYMVRNIVEIHDGRLKIDSEEGKESKVTVVFPRLLN